MAIRQHNTRRAAIAVTPRNPGKAESRATFGKDADGHVESFETALPGEGKAEATWPTDQSEDWYDFTVTLATVEIRDA